MVDKIFDKKDEKKAIAGANEETKEEKKIRTVKDFMQKNKYIIENTYKKNKISTKNIDKALYNYSIGEASLNNFNDNYNKFKDDIKEFVADTGKKIQTMLALNKINY